MAQPIDVLLQVRARIDEILRAGTETRRVADETRRAVDASRQLGSGFRNLVGAAATFAGINLSVQGLVSALRNGVAGGFRLAETFEDTSERLDTTSTAVQVLDFTFRRGGQSIEEAEKLAFKFNERLLAAAAGSESAARPIHRLGLSIQQLLALPAERRLEALAVAMVRNKGNADAMSAAIEILGTKSQKTFANLERLALPGGFNAQQEQMQAMGQAIDENLNKRLEETKQRLEDFERRWQIIAATAAGAAVSIGDKFVAEAKRIDQATEPLNEFFLRLEGHPSRGPTVPAGAAAAIDLDFVDPSEALRAALRDLADSPEALGFAKALGDAVKANFEKVFRDLQDSARGFSVIDLGPQPGPDFGIRRDDPRLQAAEAAAAARLRAEQRAAIVPADDANPIAALQRRANPAVAREAQAAQEAAAAAAQKVVIAEEAAGMRLKENGEQLRAQVKALQDALLSDEARLAVLQERLSLERTAGATAQAAATGPNQKALAELETKKRTLELEREIQQLEERVAQQRERTAAEGKRAAEAAARETETRRRAALELLELEVRRKETLFDQLAFERDQLQEREDISALEKQRQLNDLVERQRQILAEIILLKMRAANTATAAERVALEADIQSLLQRSDTIGAGNKPPSQDFEKQIHLADNLRTGIEGVADALGAAAVGAGNFAEMTSRAFQQLAADLAAASIRALVFRSIMSAAPGFGSFLGLDKLGFALGGYTGPGNPSEVAGYVHKREVVIPHEVVDQTGPAPWLAAISRARSGARGRRLPGFFDGGYTGDVAGGLAIASQDLRVSMPETSFNFQSSGRTFTAAPQISIPVTNHFAGGMTPPEVAAVLAEHDRQLPALMADAFARASEGMRI